jgi:predicted ATPase
VTGGPGSGKTTLVDALGAHGFPVMPEAGRAIIQDQMAIGGAALPWSDRFAFAELMLGWELRSYREAQRHAGPVLFDRGIPDVAGYLTLSGLPVGAHVARAVAAYRYRPEVFIAPPWPEIFTPDAERRQSLHEADATYHALAEAYSEAGYGLVPLPRAPVAERVRFVLSRIG